MWHPLYTFTNDADAVVVPTGLRRYKKYGKGYLKRNGEILVFETEQLAEDYVEAEIKALLLPNRKERRIAVAKRPKPVEVVEVATIEKEASVVGMPVDIHTVDYTPTGSRHISLSATAEEPVAVLCWWRAGTTNTCRTLRMAKQGGNARGGR